jgi:hypothetical protein
MSHRRTVASTRHHPRAIRVHFHQSHITVVSWNASTALPALCRQSQSCHLYLRPPHAINNIRNMYYTIRIQAKRIGSDERAFRLCKDRVDRPGPWTVCILLHSIDKRVHLHDLQPPRKQPPVQLKGSSLRFWRANPQSQNHCARNHVERGWPDRAGNLITRPECTTVEMRIVLPAA